MTEPSAFDFVDVARDFFRRSEQWRHTRNEIFSVHPKIFDRLSLAERFQTKNPEGHPLRISVLDAVEFSVLKHFFIRYFDEASILNIDMRGFEYKTPKCCVLILSSPELGTGDRAVDPTASDKVNQTKSLLFGLLGVGIITDHIATIFVDAERGAIVKFTPSFRNVTIFEQFELGGYNEYREIQERLKTQRAETRSRLSLGFNLFSRAVFESEEQMRFIYYWVALEVTCNAKNQGVVGRLANAYGVARPKIEATTLIGRIYSERNTLFHNGKFSGYDPRVERSFSCIFLDLLRHEIGLSCLRYSEKFFAWQKDIASER